MSCALISSLRILKFKPIIYCTFEMNIKGTGNLFKQPKPKTNTKKPYQAWFFSFPGCYAY